MASVLSEIQSMVAAGQYVFSRHAIDRSELRDRPSQMEAVDILKSGWHEQKYDEQGPDGRWKYRISGRARTGKDGSVVVTVITTANSNRALVITVF